MPTTKQKQPGEITEEARGYLERAAELEAARPTVEAQAVLGDPEAQVKLQGLDREIGELREKAEMVMTPERQRATQEANKKMIREREEAAERGRLAQLVSGAILRYRGEEYARLGVVPGPSGRVELPKDRLLRAVNEAEAMLAATGVGVEDARRLHQLADPYGLGAGKLLGMSYDEAAKEYLGKPAREIRDPYLDKQLGIRLDAESGRLVDLHASEATSEAREEEEPDVA